MECDEWCNEPFGHPWQTCSLEQIRQYTRFPALFNERKFARPFPKEKQTLSFTDDLPPELRLLVYDHLFDTASTMGGLVPNPNPHNSHTHPPNNKTHAAAPPYTAPRALELWAPSRRHDHPAPSSTNSRKNHRAATTTTTTRGRRDSKAPLRILRLSRLVHEEAAAHFYGRTSLRFSAPNGLAAMAAFARTIGARHSELVRHVTVRLPNRPCPRPGAAPPRHPPCATTVCVSSGAHWDAFGAALRARGVRALDFGVRRWHVGGDGRRRGDVNHDRAVGLAYRQLLLLRDSMGCLRTLEVLIPWEHDFISRPAEGDGCCCLADGWAAAAGPREVVRHHVEAHSRDPGYWALLADLGRHRQAREGAADGGEGDPGLTISLVLVHGQNKNQWWNPPRERRAWPSPQQARWLEAYAKVMGYRFGQTWPEGHTSSYVVRYDMNELLSASLDQDESNPMLEPPELD